MNKIIKNKQLLLILILIFLNATIQMLLVIGGLYLKNLFHNVNKVGFVLSLLGLGAIVGGYLGGHLSDRFNKDKILRFSILGNLIVFILMPFTNTFIVISILFLLTGFFNMLFRPVSLLYLLTFIHEFSELIILSYRRVAINLGFSLGAVLLISSYGFMKKLPFFIFVIICIISLLISVFVRYNDTDVMNKSQNNTSIEINTIKVFY